MCKYCKRLEELRKEDRIIYDRVLEHYKKELRKDDNYFRKCEDLIEHLVSMNGYSNLSLYWQYEYRDLCYFFRGNKGGDDNA